MTTAPSVAVNLLWLLPGQVGGSEEYLVRQLSGLDPALAHVPLTLLVQPEFLAAHPALAERHPTLVSPSYGTSRRRRIVAENSWLYERTAGVQLVHHAGGTAPLRGRRPYVLTLHDLQYRTYPQYFSRAKRRWFDLIIPRSVRRAAVVAVPSEYVRRTVIDTWHVPDDRVLVVPHGFDPPGDADITPAEVVRRTYGLGDGRLLVYPAVTHPHKAHRFLVELMERHWSDDDLRLVLIGGVGTAEADTRSADDRVVRLGRVSDADRNGLLATAHAMVFPSRYEGFGAPVVEAMALGCPVLASDRTALPEVVGAGGITAPLDHDAWADALATLTAERSAWVDAGRRRAANFGIAASGAALAAAYGRALR